MSILASSTAAAEDVAQESTALSAPQAPHLCVGPSANCTAAVAARDRPPEKHYWRTALELSAVIGLGTAWYWIDRERQVADWDYPGWKKKILFAEEIFIFDNNPFHVNYVWHAFAGAGSQALGRSNGLGIYESAGFGLLSSIAWEYGIESRELVSINDLWITNTTGIAAGEFFHRLGQYLQQGQRGIGWDTLRWTLGFPAQLHSKADGSVSSSMPQLSPDFRFSYGFSVADANQQNGASDAMTTTSGQLHSVAFDGRLVALDGYMTPGLRSQFFHDANFTSFRLQFAGGDGSRVDAYGDTILAGWRRQHIPEPGEPGIGSGINVGTSIGYLYHREQIGDWVDRLGGLHLPGLAFDGALLGKNWHFRTQVRGHIDYMGVHSRAYTQWRDAHLNEDTTELGKSILHSSGYYYGLGLSGRLNAELTVSRVSVGGSLFYGTYQSIEGFDRRREDLPYEIKGDDQLFDYGAWLRARVYGRTFVEVAASGHRRSGRMEEFTADATMTQFTFSLGTQLL